MEFITPAITTGKAPSTSATERLILRNGKAFRTLVNEKGVKTKSGAEYERQTATALPVGGFDSTQQPRRNGDVEYIRVKGGHEKVVLKYDQTTNAWKYTALGKKFFSLRRIEFIVKIPAMFDGTRANGQPYSRPGLFPVSNVTLDAHLSGAQRDARIKVETRRQFTAWPILAEFSDERVTAQDRPWHITEMITTPAAAGPVTNIVDRPLGTQPIICNLPFSGQICQEAFDDHDNMVCIPR